MRALTVERPQKERLWRLDDGLKGARDGALLPLAFAGGFRLSEIAALDLDALRFEERGLVVTLRHSPLHLAGVTFLPGD
jgi:site-specific recombinase XerC